MEKAHDLSREGRTLDVSLEENIKFSDMLLSESTLAGLEGAGFRKPSPIQKKAIPFGRCGYDLLVQAKSGTGKTCVFAVIAMEMLVPTLEKLQVVILAPTREISVQISNVISSMTRCMGKPKVASFIGGLPLEQDKKKLSKCQVAVGAPGRMKHLISAGLMDLRSVRLFVLDEADRLMEENFRKDISYIYSKLPLNKQIIAVSATFSDELEKFVTEMMKKPMKVSPGEDAILLGVRQFAAIIPSHPAVLVQMKNKTSELTKILSTVSFKQCLVFSNYQSRAESICEELAQEGWPAVYINGSQTQTERLKVFNSLKEYRCRVLVSTDLTSRGIDAENVNLIVNLDLPYNRATYIHRIGRAGRYGTHGISITILQDGEEVTRFRNLLYEIGGENFHVKIFPKEKPVFDIWTARDDKFEKLKSLSGEYKFVKKQQEVEHMKKPSVNFVESIDDETVIGENRQPSPEKQDLVNFEALAEGLKNFEMAKLPIEIDQTEIENESITDVPANFRSLLMRFEKEGWKSFYRKHKLTESDYSVSSNINNGEVDSCPCGSDEEELSSDECENSATSSNSSENEVHRQQYFNPRGYAQTALSTNINNWYATWFQQTRLIRNYVEYCHYWKEMINFR